ncbi:alpha/beta hydrolase [Aeromicrobium wangtongii]|uniref:alpha/beta hydrolase n=1 Tax=Aeromicrobium wangtongii TaxID=2969247 RepID=UPI0020170BA6|nr:hypothetical protein [Aeromicrobium wangtongii]MCL3817090.1 hypothetical protein [Aeromicrobium wangtongii]
MTRTEEYAPGRLLDVRGETGPVVLLWHGRGADARGVLATLSERIAGHGLTVVTADWDADRPDGGRGDLLGSLGRARELAVERDQDPDTITVAGWSLGAVAATGLALDTEGLGLGVGALVLIAPADGPRAVNALSGRPLPASLPDGAGRCHIDIVYGESDTVTPPDMVCGLELRLRAAGWATSLHELDGDHGDVVGSTYDERRDAYVPAATPRALAGATATAQVVAAAATSSS